MSDFHRWGFVTCLALKTIAVPCVLIRQGVLNTYFALNYVFPLDLFGLLMC